MGRFAGGSIKTAAVEIALGLNMAERDGGAMRQVALDGAEQTTLSPRDDV
jgi:hypothetical protein